MTKTHDTEQAGHTPGPWCVKETPWPWGFHPATIYEIVSEEVRGREDDEYEFQTSIVHVNNAATDRGTASKFGEYPNSQEAEANARLIVTAPDGLAIAEQIVELLDPVILVERDHPTSHLRDVLLSAIALIAKAKGQTHE